MNENQKWVIGTSLIIGFILYMYGMPFLIRELGIYPIIGFAWYCFTNVGIFIFILVTITRWAVYE